MREQDELKSKLRASFDEKSAEKSLISLVKLLARHAARCDYDAHIQANIKPDEDAP